MEVMEMVVEVCFLIDLFCFVSLIDCIFYMCYVFGTEVFVCLSGSGFVDSEG